MNHRIFTIVVFLVIILFGMSYSLAQDDTTSYNNIGVSDIGGANDFCEDCACRDAEAVDESYSICRNIEESKSVDDAVYRLGDKKDLTSILLVKEYNKQVAMQSTSASGENLAKNLSEMYEWISDFDNFIQLSEHIGNSIDIAVLDNGYAASLGSILSSFNEAVVPVYPEDISSMTQKILVIPSAGLKGLDTSQTFRNDLQNFVRDGGKLIVFSQQHGYEYNILHSELSAFGFSEDQSCQFKSVEIVEDHPIFSLQSSAQPSINVDGYFINWPKDAKVLMKRTKNLMPAMILLRYGNGTMLVTTSYADISNTLFADSAEDISLVRNIMAWAKGADNEYSYGQGISIPLVVENHGYPILDLYNSTLSHRIAYKDADTIAVKIYGSDNKIAYEKMYSQQVAANTTATVDLLFTSTKPDIYYIDYELQKNGESISRSYDAERFAVSRKLAGDTKRNITFTVNSDKNIYESGSAAVFIINIWNNGNEDKSIRVDYNWWHGWLGRSYDTGTNTLEIRAGSNVAIPVTIDDPKRSGRFFATFYEGSNYLGTSEAAISVIAPQVNITAFSDKTSYIPGEAIKYSSSFLLDKAKSYSVEVRIMDSKNKLIASKQVSINSSTSFDFEDILSRDASAGYGRINVDVKDDEKIVATKSVYFEIEKYYNIDIKFEDSLNKVRAQDSRIDVVIKNSNIMDIDSVLNLSILSWSDSQQFHVGKGKTVILTFTAPLNGFVAGSYSAIARSDSVETIETFFIPNAYLTLGTVIDNNIQVILSNDGGSASNYSCIIKVFDKDSTEVYDDTILGNIEPEQKVEKSVILPGNLVAGEYLLRIGCFEELTNRNFFKYVRFNATGISAGLSSNIGTQYSINENIDSTISLSNNVDNARLIMSVKAKGDIDYFETGNISSIGGFVSPRQLKTDVDGNLYVADYGGNKVNIYSANGNYLRSFNKYVANGQNKTLSKPYGVSLDDNYVYITDANGMYKFLKNGTFVLQFTDTQNPVGIGVINNVIYALRQASGVYWFQIRTYSTLTGSYISSLDSTKDGRGITFDSNGNMYVADCDIYEYGSIGGGILIFNSTGKRINAYVLHGSGDGQFNGSCDIAIENDKYLYVADRNNSRIQKFSINKNYGKILEKTDDISVVLLMHMDQTGSELQDFSGYGNHGVAEGAIAQAGKFNYSLYFDGSNDYVSIPRMVSDDFTISFWIKTVQTGGTGQWYNGKGLVDGEVGGVANDFGTVLLGSKFGFGVGNPDTTITSTTSINDGQWHYVAATREKATGKMAVYVDGIIESTGTGSKSVLTSPSNLRIAGIQTGSNYFNGNVDELVIYNRVLTSDEVLSNYNRGVLDLNVVSSDNISDFRNITLSFVNKWGAYGSGNNEFKNPYGITYDESTGTIIVSDSDNALIKRFTTDGVFVEKFPNGPALSSVQGVVAGDDYIYVVDVYQLGTRFIKYDKSGNYITSFDVSKYFDQYKQFHDMDIDSMGNVYVLAATPIFGTGTENNQLIKLSKNLEYVKQWSVPSLGTCFVNCPTGGMFIHSDVIYGNHPNSYSNSTIYKWDTEGTLLGNITALAYMDRDIIIDNDGNIYGTRYGSQYDDIVYLNKVNKEGSFEKTIFSSFGYYVGLSIGSNRIYLTSTATKNLTIIDYDGSKEKTLGFNATTSSVSFNGGNVYVADSTNNIIRIVSKSARTIYDKEISPAFVQNSISFVIDAPNVYEMEAVLYSNNSQKISSIKKSFIVTDGSLTLETDKRFYLAGQDVAITGVVKNIESNAKSYVVEVMKDDSPLLNETVALDPGQIYKYSIQTKATTSFLLTARAGSTAIKDMIIAEEPSLDVSIDADKSLMHGLYKIPVAFKNNNNFTLNFNATINGIKRILSMPALFSTTVETELLINKNTTLTVDVIGDVIKHVEKDVAIADYVSTLIKDQTNPSNNFPLAMTFTNHGSVDSSFDISLRIGSTSLSKSYFITAGSTADKIFYINLTDGNHVLEYETPFESGKARIIVASGAVISIEPEQNMRFNNGENAIFRFFVENIGVLKDKAEITLVPLGLSDTNLTESVYVDAGEKGAVEFTVNLPDDLEEKDYRMQYIYDGKIKDFWYHVYGINISVGLQLDKQYYKNHDTASANITVKNNNNRNAQLFSRMKFNDYDQIVSYTLGPNEEKIIPLTIPISFGSDKKIYFSVYHNDGRSIYINTTYVYEDTGDVRLRTDSDIYKSGDTVTMTIENTADTTKSVVVVAPRYNETIELPAHSSQMKIFELKEKMTGTYNIQYTVDGITYSHPIDVEGFGIYTVYRSVDKQTYSLNDDMLLKLTLGATKDVHAMINFYVYDLSGSEVGSANFERDLVAGEQELEFEIPISSGSTGVHTVSYSIQANISGHSVVEMTSGTSYFDVEGDVTAPSLISYNIVIDKDLREVLLQFITDENAVCRYSMQSNTPYDNMK